MQKVVIVIPCYNEEKRLSVDHLLSFSKSNPDLQIVLVNDGSTDKTLEIIKEMSLLSEDIKYLSLNENSGKAEAVRVGFIWAINNNYEIIGYYDADLATPLSELKSALVFFQTEKFDILLASRVQLLGFDIERSPLRHYLGRIFATAASILLQIKVYDTQCGLKIFRNNKILLQVFSKPFLSKWIFDVEILMRLKVENSKDHKTLNAIEFPLHEWKDKKGSKLSLWSYIDALIDYLRLFFTYRM